MADDAPTPVKTIFQDGTNKPFLLMSDGSTKPAPPPEPQSTGPLPMPEPSLARELGRSARSGMAGALDYGTLGHYDELTAALDHPLSALGSAFNFGDEGAAYRQRRNELRKSLDEARGEYPAAYHAGGIGTTVATAAAAAPKAAAEGLTLGAKMLRGALMGGVAGEGGSTAELAKPGEREIGKAVADTAIGAGLGAGAAAAAHGVGKLGERLAGKGAAPGVVPPEDKVPYTTPVGRALDPSAPKPPKPVPTGAVGPEGTKLVDRILKEAGEGREYAGDITRANKSVRDKLRNVAGDVTGEEADETKRAAEVLMAPEMAGLRKALDVHGGDKVPRVALQAVKATLAAEGKKIGAQYERGIKVDNLRGIDEALNALNEEGDVVRRAALKHVREALASEFATKGGWKVADARALKTFTEQITSAAFPAQTTARTPLNRAELAVAQDVRQVLINAIDQAARKTEGVDADLLTRSNRSYAVLSALRDAYKNRIENTRAGSLNTMGLFRQMAGVGTKPLERAAEGATAGGRSAARALGSTLAEREAAGTPGYRAARVARALMPEGAEEAAARIPPLAVRGRFLPEDDAKMTPDQRKAAYGH